MKTAGAAGDFERKATQADNNIRHMLKELTAVSGQLATLTKVGNEHTERLDGIGHVQKTSLVKLSAIDKSIEQHGVRLDSIDTRLDGVDNRLDGIDTRLGGVENRLDGVETKLVEHDARFDGLESRLDGVGSKLTEHGMSFDAIGGRLDGMDKVQSSMIVKLESFDETLRDQSRNIRFMEGNTHDSGKTLAEHSVALGRLTAMVDAHTGILTEHTQVLSNLVGKVEKHGVRFDRVDSRFDVVDRTLAAINDKLDGALSA